VQRVRYYWNTKTNDPVYKEFRKAYKRTHSRVKYKTKTKQEFYDWSEEARRKRDESTAGRLSPEAFREWLGEQGAIRVCGVTSVRKYISRI